MESQWNEYRGEPPAMIAYGGFNPGCVNGALECCGIKDLRRNARIIEGVEEWWNALKGQPPVRSPIIEETIPIWVEGVGVGHR